MSQYLISANDLEHLESTLRNMKDHAPLNVTRIKIITCLAILNNVRAAGRADEYNPGSTNPMERK